jgi:NAD(P)-dependent dehydrogenase (short-subunit alcohol dehydrogenase family)
MNEPNLGVALVTGAYSGIGHATAKALRNAGFRVFGTSRRAAAERSDGAIMLSCDVTDDASVAELVDEVLAEAGRIDVLVNNAGIGLLGGAEESSTAQAQALFDVNVFGVLRMTKAVLPTMRRQRKRRIINMSSIMGLIPAPYNALYASTKHAIEGYSESLDHELRTFGIRVALVEPGFTRTSFEENLAKPDCLLAALRSRACWHGSAHAERCGIGRRSRGGGRDGCAGGNGCGAEKTIRRWKAGAPGKAHAPFCPRIRFRQEPAEAQPSAGLMSTSIRPASPMYICTCGGGWTRNAQANSGRYW